MKRPMGLPMGSPWRIWICPRTIVNTGNPLILHPCHGVGLYLAMKFVGIDSSFFIHIDNSYISV